MAKKLPFDKFWDDATNQSILLFDAKYALVKRASEALPGIMIGLPVRIKHVDPPKPSTKNRELPYINVLVEMPSGEIRSINGDVLVPCTEADFESIRNVIKTFPTWHEPTVRQKPATNRMVFNV